MLTVATIEHILERLPELRIGVVGDLFLDRYLDLDATLTEPSLETGLDAYQVVNVRAYPGAAGTVLNNLVALGVGRVAMLTVIGDDGEGYELRRELERRRVDGEFVLQSDRLRTPTYVKPMLREPGVATRELNRLDVKNRYPLAQPLEEFVLAALPDFVATNDALIIVDQVSEAECGIVTTKVRERLAELGEKHPDKFQLADSRERIGLFRAVALKPNEAECLRAVQPGMGLEQAVRQLAATTGRPVFCTRGARGMLLAAEAQLREVPAYPVNGPIDPVGAGDSTSAAIAAARAAGRSLEEAAAFGNLVASITIQQLGTTGVATPEGVRTRWLAVAASGVAT